MPQTLEQTTLTVGDTTPGLTGSIPASLVGATAITAHVKRPDGTVLSRVLVPVDAAAGTWELPVWTAGDLNEAGWYELEVQVTFADDSVQTFWADPDNTGAPVVFYVRDQLA